MSKEKTPMKRELPRLSEDAFAAFKAFKALSAADRTFVMARSSELIRAAGVASSKTLQASEDEGARAQVGDEVRILSGNVKAIGQTGIVTKARRVRVFVQVTGASKPIYLFRSDVAPVSAVATDDATEEVAATG